MRNVFAETFYQLAGTEPRLAMVVADISPAGAMNRFRQDYPDRFIDVGVAEQGMIMLTAGMALGGLRPFAYTIATFALFRPFEFIRDDLCYQNLSVTVVGIGGGIGYASLGATHHAMEDLAVASAIPNLQVFVPCDPGEVRCLTRYLATESRGPAYLRLGRAGEPDLSADALEPCVPGRLRHLRRGSDTAILACGPILKLGLEVADRLSAAGEWVTVASVHTVKPLDRAGVQALLLTHRRVVVIEEHVAHGGLGSQVKELAWESGASCQLHCFALRNQFLHVYGQPDELLAAHGLSTAAIFDRLAQAAP